MKNYYQEIKLNPSMEIDQIERALNKFEKYWNERLSSPDLTIKKLAEDNLKLVEEARSILLNKDEKEKYDNELREFYISKKYKNITFDTGGFKSSDIITEDQKEKIEEITKKSVEKSINISKKSLIKTKKFIKNNMGKFIIASFVVGCLICSGIILRNINIGKDLINAIKEENNILLNDIKEGETKNKELKKELTSLEKDNEHISTEVESIKNTQFSAVAGTRWVGMRSYENVMSRPISLNITEDDIIMTFNKSRWERYENHEVEFTANLKLATGEVNKETGYMKLNTIDFINPPEGTEDYKDEYAEYNYECIVNGNTITGLIINKDDKVVGNILLTKEV